MNRKALFILFIMVSTIVQTGIGQRPVNKNDIREKVVLLLNDYQNKLGAIKPNLDSDPIRELTVLFSNPHVKVVNNLSDQPLMPELSLRNYCLDIRDNFPDGVNISINPAGIRLGSIEAEHGDQYFVTVRLTLTLRAFSGGVVYENKQQFEMKVTFQWDGEFASNFRIANIAVPQFNKQEIGLGMIAGGLRLSAPWMANETRVGQKLDLSYGGYFKYRLWLKPGFGIGYGVGWNNLRSKFSLDQFNPYNGRNPNLSDIEMNTSMLNVSLPLFVSLRSDLSERVIWYADLGLQFSYRYWGTFTSSGTQQNLENQVMHVISYPEWENDLATTQFLWTIEGGLEYLLMKNLKICAGIQLMGGITPIDKGSDLSFETQKYTGQYNPLWMSPDNNNYIQHAGLRIGVSYTLEPNNK